MTPLYRDGRCDSDMRNVQAALWGIVCAVVATMLGTLLYEMVRTGAPLKGSDAILLVQLALFGWYLYLVPGAALGIGTRPILRRFGASSADVFEAFVNPDITTQFWFTKGSGRLEAGKQVQWD
jgi:hypothetical protein